MGMMLGTLCQNFHGIEEFAAAGTEFARLPLRMRATGGFADSRFAGLPLFCLHVPLTPLSPVRADIM
jgi:hypothetical protein